MKVKVYYTELPTGIFATRDFSIAVINRCLLDTLTISSTKFATPALSYYIRHVGENLNWADTDVTSTLGLTTCGALTWSVKKIDGLTDIDSAVFPLLNLSTKVLFTYTTDFAKEATYPMQVKVHYTELPTISATRDFSIAVINRCLLDTLTISSTKFASPALSYDIRNAAGVLSWTDTDVTSSLALTTCGALTWSVT